MELLILSLNSIDVLTGIETVKICVAYRYNGEVIEEFPASLKVLGECEPVYEELPGWTEDITGCQIILMNFLLMHVII